MVDPGAGDYEHQQRQGGAAVRADRLTDALAAFGAAVCLRPDLVDAHLKLGDCLARMGELDAARRVIEKAEQIAPSHPAVSAARRNLGTQRPGRLDYRVGEVLHGADGSYRVRRVIRGGHGAVYIVDLQPGSSGHLTEATYALKTFQTRYLGRGEDQDRFAHEAITWVSLDPHPNVVTALWVERIEGLPGLLLEYVPSGDLAQLISKAASIKAPGLPAEQAMRFGIQVCAGLDHASRALGIVHGDIKPSNCLVTAEEVLKVTDFGLAHAFGSVRDTGAELAVLPEQVRQLYCGTLGTPSYQAPEQSQPGARIDVRTDIYALGVLLYEMVSGERPRVGGVALEHIEQNPPPAELPDRLITLIRDCVAAEARDRPQSYRDVRETLELAYQVAIKRPAPAVPAMTADPVITSIRRGASLTRLGRPDEAIQWLTQVIDQDPDQRQALLHLGIALTATGRSDEALNCLNHLLALDPDAAPALVAKAGVLRGLGSHDGALECVDRALSTDPGSRAVLRAKAEVLITLGRSPDALTCLDTALHLDPRDELALTLRGQLLARTGRYAEALHDLDQALQINPTATAAGCERGCALIGLGRYPEGLSWLDRGSEQDLDREGRRIARSRALRGLGRTDEALAELDRALDLDPDDEVAWGERYELLCATGHRDEAEQDAEQRRQRRSQGTAPPEPAGSPSPSAPAPLAPTQPPQAQPPPGQPSSGQARYSPAVLLAWDLAAWERNVGAAELIEPAHLLLGVAKLCDIDLAAAEGVKLDQQALAAIQREVAYVRGVFQHSGVDLTSFRRTLRARLARHGAGSPPRRTAHRSRTSRRAFQRAEELSSIAGTPAVQLDHLLPAVLEELLGHRGADPRGALVAIATSVQGARMPAEVAAPAPALVTGLEAFGRDLTALATAGKLGPVIGRDDEVRNLAGVLARANKSNALLIGEPGVGKTAVVEALAIALAGAQAPPALGNRRLVELSVTALVAGTKYRGEFEERLRDVIAEASNDANVVLFIDELHTILGAGSSIGGLDAANILKPALARGEIQLIGATTETDYRRYIENDAALTRRFQLIRLEEPTAAGTATILRGLRPGLQQHHDVQIDDTAIDAAVQLAQRHQPDRRFPDKAIDLLDQACADARLRPAESTTCISWDEVATTVATRLRVPIERLTRHASGRLTGLADALNSRVIGQPAAVAAVSDAVQAARVGLADPARPSCSLLLAGPPGTGKTELAKALAEFLAGSGRGLIHIDLSEYGEPHTLPRLLGALPGYSHHHHDDDGPLIGPIRADPFSVVLFDAVDKAHPRVLDAVAPILDGGSLTDIRGRQASFADAVVIFTATVGGQAGSRVGFQPTTPAGEQAPSRQHEELDAELRRVVRPELLSRLSQVVYFEPLDPQALRRIVDRSLAELRVRLDDQKVELTISDEVLVAIENEGRDGKQGARAAIAALDRLVAGPIARELVASRSDQARTLVVELVDGEPVVRTR